jgi:hypothetical protein
LYTATAFASPLIGAIALKSKTRLKNLAFVVAGLMAGGLLFFACFHDFTIVYWPSSFDGNSSQKSLVEEIGNADAIYLPKGASLNAIANYQTPIFEDGRKLTAANQLTWQLSGTDRYTLNAKLSQAGTVSVPLFWFEGWWKVQYTQGHIYTTSATPVTDHIQLALPAGNSKITIKLQDTPLHFFSNILSLLTAVTLGIVVLLLLLGNYK